ncbi:MAG: AgmX/PglI C-terminal domain-containing protein [Gammaproteobacteria bacterium]|nr:AgmX/PglI C-terminal domain-containing protein [Gammaproteobacteria bacterium]
MTSLTYENIALNWTPKRERDHRFNILASIFVLGLFVVGLVLSTIELPKSERKTRTVIPERVAKFILQKEKIKKVKPKPIPKPKIQLKPKRKDITKKTLSKNQKKARKKAADSGLLALGNELADLIDTKSISAMVGSRAKHSSSAQKKASVDTNVLTSNISKGSGGVNSNDGPTITGTTQLSKADRLAVRQAITTKSASDKSRKKTYRGEGLRSDEEITIVMDQNKSQLHSLYRRALRRNPGLKGKLVLAITILPTGVVSKIEVRSSELNAPSLEKRIIARIKRFNFGARGVEKVTVTYPIEFLPS